MPEEKRVEVLEEKPEAKGPRRKAPGEEMKDGEERATSIAIGAGM